MSRCLTGKKRKKLIMVTPATAASHVNSTRCCFVIVHGTIIPAFTRRLEDEDKKIG